MSLNQDEVLDQKEDQRVPNGEVEQEDNMAAVKLPAFHKVKISVKGAKLHSAKGAGSKGLKMTMPKMKAAKKITAKVASPLKFKK